MDKINKKFFSEENNKPFNKCVFCEHDILDSEEGYIVEKAFVLNKKNNSHELVFEYAICLECINRLSSEMSKESSKNIEKYFSENIKELSFVELFDTETRISKCMISGNKIDDLDEYQIAAFYIKTEMLVTERFPYLISGSVMLEIQELISEKTKGFLDNFKDLIIPPQKRDKIPKDRILIF